MIGAKGCLGKPRKVGLGTGVVGLSGGTRVAGTGSINIGCLGRPMKVGLGCSIAIMRVPRERGKYCLWLLFK